MRRWVALVSLLLSACAVPLREGASTAEVSAALGNPGAVFTLPDGSSNWEYSTSPLGLTTTLVRFSAQGRLLEVSQALTDDNFHRIRDGEDADSVRAILGPPWRRMDFERLGQLSWDYLYRDTWGYRVEASILFDRQGRVVGKAFRRLDDSRNDR